jgi:hypothetical protein
LYVLLLLAFVSILNHLRALFRTQLEAASLAVLMALLIALPFIVVISAVTPKAAHATTRTTKGSAKNVCHAVNI